MTRLSILRRDLKGDAARDVRLDDAGDDVGARRLRGDDEVNAGRARHLRDARDRAFHVGRRGLHQVGQLVDDDDDVGHVFGNDDVVIARDFDCVAGGTRAVASFVVRHRRRGALQRPAPSAFSSPGAR